MKVVTKLAAHGFYQSPNTLTDSQLLSIKVGGTTIFSRNRELKSLLLKKLLFQWLGEIASIAQQQAAITGGQLRHHTQVMDVSRSQSKRLDHADRVDLKMQPETVKGLVAKLLTVIRKTSKKLAPPGSGESADSNRQAVQHHSRIRKILGDVFKQSLFYRPEIGGLSDKTDPTTELRKVMAVESFEKFEDGLVGIQTETFADDFHRKYFTIRQLGQRPTFSEGSFWKIIVHKIIDFAEDFDDKIIKIHFNALHSQRNNVFTFNSIGQRAFFVLLKSQKPVHSVRT